MATIRTWCAATATVLAAPLLAAPVLAAAAVPPSAAAICAADPGDVGDWARYTWTGGAETDAWSSPLNWAVAGTADPLRPVPGETANDGVDHTEDAVVCIDPPTTTVITADQVYPHVAALVVGSHVTIEASGSRILAYGGADAPSDKMRSSFAAGSALMLQDSYFGGTAEIDFDGHLEWAVPGTGASTLTNDVCDLAGLDLAVCNNSTAHLPPDGRLVLGAAGSVSVADRGVNLKDGFQVETLAGSTVTISGDGYIAADQNTRITIGADAELTFDGDGNVFEGFLNGTSLPDFVNEGRVAKLTGTGISSINADYSGSGGLDVQSGTLNIANGTAAPTSVAAGATVGTGRCAEAVTCVPDTSDGDLQNAAVTLDAANAGLSVAEEQVVTPEQDLQPAVAIDAAGEAGAGTLRLTYDRKVVDQVGYTRVEVFRGPSPIPNCTAAGDFPNGVVTACVRGRTRLGRSVQIDIRARASGLEGQWRAQARPHFYRASDPIIGGHYSCAVAPASFPATVRVPIWHRVAGNVSLYRRVTPTSPQSFVKTVVTPAGVTSMPITVTKTGYVRLGEPSGLYSNLYRVVATGSVKYTRLTRKVSQGRTVTIRGSVTPGRFRSYQLYLKSPGGGLLKPVGKVRSTSSTGAFAVRYTVPRDARIGTWRFAVKLAKDDARALRPAMSFRAVKVYVARAAVTPVETAPVSTDYVSTGAPSAVPTPDVSWELRAATTCSYYVP